MKYCLRRLQKLNEYIIIYSSPGEIITEVLTSGIYRSDYEARSGADNRPYGDNACINRDYHVGRTGPCGRLSGGSVGLGRWMRKRDCQQLGLGPLCGRYTGGGLDRKLCIPSQKWRRKRQALTTLMRRKVIFAAAAIIAAAALILPADAATFVLPAGTYQFSEVLQQAGAPDLSVFRFYSTYLDQYGATITGDRIVPWGYSSGRYRMALGSYPCYYYDGGGWAKINNDRIFVLTQDATIDTVFQSWFNLNVHPYTGGYPAVQVSVIDHRIVWSTPQHSGTLLNYEVLRYDDDSLIATLPADTTSYQPLYSDRLYIRTFYESTEGEGIETDSNDVDYIAYYPTVTIEQEGYRISWEAPTGFPSLAEIKGYIIYIDGVQAGVTQQTNTLIVQGGTYEVQVQYQGTTRSTLSNAITYTPTEEDQLPMINNQLTLIREMIQQRDMADPEVIQALQDLVQATQGLAQEDTLQSVLERLTDLYNAILEHYGGASEDAAEIITQLTDVATQLRDLPRTDQLPDIEIPEVGVEDFTSAISGLTVLAGALAPLAAICFCYPKIAIYMTISIIIAIILAILRHGVD